MKKEVSDLKIKIENLRNELNMNIVKNIDINEFNCKERLLFVSEELDILLLDYIRLIQKGTVKTDKASGKRKK